MVASSSNANGEDEPRQLQMQTEIRDVLSALTGRLGGLGSRERGFGTITLAGENKGATMKAEIEELLESDDSGMHTYANSNYQAVNNSILLGGSTTAEDPGVHVDITEYIEEEEEEQEEEEDEEEDAHEKKEKKKEKKKREKEKEKKKKKKEKEEEEKKKKKKKEEKEEEEETKKKEKEED
ncbi:uncharacterized protein LOC141814864 [Curcuma longa]|uniref:uncharacterized protein LOC141814864 n=1 Tax=Curcuma longa TaxID=136217 RepID=UPI003D9E6B12